MFFVLGFSQEHRPVESLLTTHCRCCAREASWTLWRETGWASLFLLRLLPLTRQEWLICEQCDDAVCVDRQTAKLALARDTLSPLLKQIIHDRLVTLIDMHQGHAARAPAPTDEPQRSDQRAR